MTTEERLDRLETATVELARCVTRNYKLRGSQRGVDAVRDLIVEVESREKADADVLRAEKLKAELAGLGRAR